MKSFIRKHIPFVVMTSLLLLMIIFLIILQILKQNQNIAEAWSRGFSRSYNEAFGRANQYIPFSLTETSFIVSIISCSVFIAWGACCFGNRQIWQGIHKMLMVALVITGTITMYSASVGMNYNRKPVDLETYTGEIKKEEFEDIATYFVNDLNYCADKLSFDDKGELIMPYSEETLMHKLRDEFARLPKNGYYNSYIPKAKQLSTSGLFTSVSIVGVYFGVLGEANYNTFSTKAELPFYVMHELAHGAGTMREDDAQLVATFLSLTSEDPYIRYSGYFNTIDRILELTDHCDDKGTHDRVKSQIGDKYWKNNQYFYDHWKGNNFISDLGDKINDWYLRTFGQNGGTSSYIDTDPETDEKGNVIVLSKYQSIYVKYYYDMLNK